MLRTKHLYIALIFISLNTLAQADIKLSSFYFSPLTINPAYAGTYEGITFTSLYSSQFVGFDGAPKTLLLSGHGTFLNSKTGLGMDIIQDQIGAMQETNVTGDYSYQLQLNDNWKLAFGIKAGFRKFVVDYSLLTIDNPQEFLNSSNLNSNLNPIFGSGLYLHSKKIYLGIGIPNLIKNTFQNSYKNPLSTQGINTYVTAGTIFKINENFDLKPQLLVRFSAGNPTSYLLSLLGNLNDKAYFGINNEVNTSLGMFTGLKIQKSLMLGYSYDHLANRFSNYSNGSHSFFLQIQLADFWKRERCSFCAF